MAEVVEEFISKAEAEQLIQQVVDTTTPQEALDVLRSFSKEDNMEKDVNNMKIGETMNMTPEQLASLLSGLKVDVNAANRAADAAKAANPNKDDRFILRALIEDYGTWMGAAALTILVIYWIKTKFSSDDAVEAGAAALSFITGK